MGIQLNAPLQHLNMIVFCNVRGFQGVLDWAPLMPRETPVSQLSDSYTRTIFFLKSYKINPKLDIIYYFPIDLQQQTDGVRLIPNQSVHGKYNLISGWFNKISKRIRLIGGPPETPRTITALSHWELDIYILFPSPNKEGPGISVYCIFLYFFFIATYSFLTHCLFRTLHIRKKKDLLVIQIINKLTNN